MAEDCKKRNGGRPVIVGLKKQYLGQVELGGTESRSRINAPVTTTGSNSAQISGTVRSTTPASCGSVANYNQAILYRCVDGR
jgi:hypothetical protein